MSTSRALSENVAIVTGAGRGIGRAVSLALADAGARVALVARTPAELDSVRSEIATAGGQAVAIAGDVSREEDVAKIVRSTLDAFGRLDILVNNAGIGVFAPLEQTTAEQWDLVMAVNARGPFLLCREAIPHLRQQARSFIVNIASVVAVKGYANQAAYGASKHALLGMSKALAKEVHADGIRVHAVCPGGVATEMAAAARPDLDPAVLMQPAEVAEYVLFLLTRTGNAVADEFHLRRDASTPWA